MGRDRRVAANWVSFAVRAGEGFNCLVVRLLATGVDLALNCDQWQNFTTYGRRCVSSRAIGMIGRADEPR
jgi:hypothetical protein